MTVPIARVVATRYATAEPPLRFSYFAHSYRDVRPQRGQPRELLQAGIELVGSPAPDGTAEALTVLCRALDAAGLRDYRIGVGDAALYPSLMEAAGVPEEVRPALLETLVPATSSAWRAACASSGWRDDAVSCSSRPAAARRAGGARARRRARPRRDAPAPARAALPRRRRAAIYDLGLVRQLGYYTGAVFEVYDPTHGAPIGRGGRYDDLLGRFGRDLPAVGFALTSTGSTSR